jgi:hypothetical protein
MCKLAAILAVALASITVIGSGSAASSHYVRGYATKNGTYVMPHRQTNPNRFKSDNWSTKGNVNPFMGKAGTKSPY